jgi:hypothetical protein
MHQGALALIDVEEGAATVARQRAASVADQTANRLRRSPRIVFIRPRLVICWQIAGKRRFGSLLAYVRPGVGPGLTCGFVVEPPAGIEPATPSLPFVWSRSIEAWVQVEVTSVTVSYRQAPSDTARYGTEMARWPVSLNDTRGPARSPP